MKNIKLLKKDFAEVENRFPKLKYRASSENKLGLLVGELDICDAAGDYWDTFNIAIQIPENYPFGIPIVMERSQIIPRETDRHISEEGICCLDVEHRLLYLAKKGIRLADFIATKVYPYFANQLFYRETGRFAGEEYAHYFEGVRQFYAEELKLTHRDVALSFLQLILTNRLPRRNDKCPCGSQSKYKNCHSTSVITLQTIGQDRLKKDMEGFAALPTESSNHLLAG